MPMERAVPAIILIAASMVAALRSGIFSSAISRTCCFVTFPTFTLLGSAEPFSTFAAFASRTEAGGVLVTKVND